MQVSSRQRAIIEILLSEQKGLTIGAIAGQIGVSARTIHRELDVLETMVEGYGLHLARKAGAGVELIGLEEQKQLLRLGVLHQTTTEFTVQERRSIILCSLLAASEPVKLISLAIELKVTTATISHDLDDLEAILSRYELTLLRKRGYGVELLGDESAKRRAISALISEHLDDHQLIGIIKENIQNKTLRDVDSLSERLLGLIDKEKLIKVENALSHLDEDLPYPLADSAYIGLVTHLALAMERVEKGKNIHFDEYTLGELRGTPEYQAAQSIMERLKRIFQLDIPAAEIGYITMHLQGSKLRNSQAEHVWPANVELMASTKRLIQLCQERLGLPLSEDASLFHGLLAHLEPALYRLKHKMEIRNPVLDQIKGNYPELFAVAREALHRLFPQLDVPDEEVGFVVMHLGAAIERTRQERQRYRALVVCSSGIGSSKILATRIKKEIPEIFSLKNLSLFEIGNVPRSDYDIIISTLPLPLGTAEYVVVSPLLPQDDIQKIKFHLHNTRQVQPAQSEATPASTRKQSVLEVKALRMYAEYAAQIVEGLRVRSWNNRGCGISEVLRRICGELQEDGTVRQVDTVVWQLLHRENYAGLSILGKAMALFHIKNEAVSRVSFTIHRLEEPIQLQSMDGQELSIHLLLLLLGPIDVTREGLEVLSEISSMLIEEELPARLETGETEEIADYVAGRLYTFCLYKTGCSSN